MQHNISKSNQLYLYRLLTQAFGIGAQVYLPRVMEALAKDGVTPKDFGTNDVHELMQTLEWVNLTDFKGGRSYISVLQREDFDAAITMLASETTEEKTTKNDKKPWKHKKTTLRPERPTRRTPTWSSQKIKTTTASNTKTRKNKPTSSPATAIEFSTAVSTKYEAVKPTETQTLENPRAETQIAPVSAAKPKQRVTSDDGHKTATAPEAAAPEATAPEATAPEAAAPEAAAPEAAAPEATAAPEAAAPEAAQPEAPQTYRQTAPLRNTLPENFWNEVFCPNILLATLERILPIGLNLHRLLQEDWLIALSTGTLEATRSRATFPLHYLRDDGLPISLTIAHQARSSSGGKRWKLIAIDGDTTGKQHEAVGFEGAQVALEGRWAKLSAEHQVVELRKSPLLNLASTMTFTSWEELCRELATLAQPERWGSAADSFAWLREYICVTFAAVCAQGLLGVDHDGLLAAWNTGLCSTSYHELYCCLVPHAGSIPWQFIGFTEAGTGVLGKQLSNAFNGELPLRPDYITSLDDIRLAPKSLVTSKRELSLEVLSALRRARSDWRVCMPVWDPQDGRTKLLVPLTTPGSTQATLALLLDHDDNDYHLAGSLRLADAYVCARIVSPSLPAWLNNSIEVNA